MNLEELKVVGESLEKANQPLFAKLIGQFGDLSQGEQSHFQHLLEIAVGSGAERDDPNYLKLLEEALVLSGEIRLQYLETLVILYTPQIEGEDEEGDEATLDRVWAGLATDYHNRPESWVESWKRDGFYQK